ncbi:MAG: ABA4-like family protein [Chroococcales cyanobacterium]
MNLELLFNAGNLFVLPFWLLMIVLPNWKVSRKVMESYLPFVPLALLYIYLFFGQVDAETAQSMSNPTLADIARFFGNEGAAATGWVHYLVMDLFVGRWIYWQGQQTGVWTTHSLLLCLFAGPMGLLSHLVTAGVTEKFFPKSSDSVTTPVSAEG